MIETLRAEPGMHGIQELWALQQCARPDLDLPEWVITELARVAAEETASSKTGLPEGASAQEVLEAARAGASRAHAYEVSLSMTRPEARIAERCEGPTRTSTGPRLVTLRSWGQAGQETVPRQVVTARLE